MGKFKFVNGVMVKDEPPTAVAVPVEKVPLAVVCTAEELIETGIKVPVSTQEAMLECQDETYLNKFGGHVDSDEIFDRISALFAAFEVPVGLLHKVLKLQEYNIRIVLDDSGSMGALTDSLISEAGPFMQEVLKAYKPSGKMTRFQEQEDRVHIMLDFLACIPSPSVEICFMNRSNKIFLPHNDTPEQWAAKAHAALRTACIAPPNGGTPTYELLKSMLGSAYGKTYFYVFTDGVPNGGPERVAELILKRKNPEQNPIALVSCTDVDDECKWMKDIEEDAPFTSETDDFKDERDEVIHDQGPVFPYTKGLWLMCLFVGAIEPTDLDALDDSRPLSRFTLDIILGREISEQEYRKYWDAHPKAKEFESVFHRLNSEKAPTIAILGAPPATAMARITARFKRFGGI